MLRTLLVVLVLVWLIVGAITTFIPGVGGTGQQSGARLEASCDRDSVQRAVTSVIRCAYVAVNDGDGVWMRPSVSLEPASGVGSPDRYHVFAVVRNGEAQQHRPEQTFYPLGVMFPGDRVVVGVTAIVDARSDFGVAAVLRPEPGAGEVDRREQRWTLSRAEPFPPLFGSLVPLWRDESAEVSPSVAAWTLVVRNGLGENLRSVRAEVFAPDYGVTLGLDDPERVSVTSAAGGLGAVVSGGLIQRELRVETRGRCAYAEPAILLSAVTSAGTTVTGAILPEAGATLNCQTLETPGFPAAGHGLSPEGAATPLRPVPLALAVSGGVLVLIGAGPIARRITRGWRRGD